MAVLFLDDDAQRCTIFRERCEANLVVVRTAAECIVALTVASAHGAVWDEVHLDHDLGGRSMDDSAREDCGMEVVRYMVIAKPDIMTVVIHTHNPVAGVVMFDVLERAGYRVVRAPFWVGKRDGAV